MGHYSIRDLERFTGIKAHTIRIWEKRYGLIEPERTITNIRAYCDAELRKLLNISILNKNGFKISKIANLSPEEITSNINKLIDQPTDTESYQENLVISMIDLDEQKFERILSRAILQYGFEETIIRIINPFYVRIGIMWQTGSINPAQEHFVSNLIRQKMFVAIDSQMPEESPSKKTFTLFLPEGELHELTLLFSNYILRKRGHRVIYLGPDVPLSDLLEIEKIKSSDFMMTACITAISQKKLSDYIYKLSQQFLDKTIYITGEQIINYTDKLPKNIKYLSSPQNLINELNYLISKE
jgi:DNA-binding transcriptional MerR regulator